ncbi:MAG: hypothetical protein RR365_08350 [Bacteroides sp.]
MVGKEGGTHSRRDAAYARRTIQLFGGLVMAESINRPLDNNTPSV